MYVLDRIDNCYISLFTEPFLGCDNDLNPAIRFSSGMGRCFRIGEYVPTRSWHYYFPDNFTILMDDMGGVKLAVIETMTLTGVYNLKTEDVTKYLNLPCYLGTGGLYPCEHTQEAMLKFYDDLHADKIKVTIEDPVNRSEYALFGGCLELLAKTYLGRGFSYDYSLERWETQTKEAREICNKFIEEHSITLDDYFEQMHISRIDQSAIREVYDNLLADDGKAKIGFCCEMRGFKDDDDFDEDDISDVDELFIKAPEEEITHSICEEDYHDCKNCRYRKVRKLPSFFADPIIPWFLKYEDDD